MRRSRKDKSFEKYKRRVDARTKRRFAARDKWIEDNINITIGLAQPKEESHESEESMTTEEALESFGNKVRLVAYEQYLTASPIPWTDEPIKGWPI